MAIPVEPGYLYSIREQSSYTWKSMVCELVDNCFDAAANNVTLSWPGGQVFSIKDDGCGTEDPMRLLTLGSRYDHQTTDIGKYGVGVKLALIWLWGQSEIHTSHNGTMRSIEADWNEIASGVAQYPSIDAVSICDANGRIGTEITCRATRAYPKFESLIKSIESTYTPGIELGKRIVVKYPKQKPFLLKGRQWPKTSQMIDTEVEAAGRTVRIVMGIVEEGYENPYSNGFSFERTYRVIKESTLGANGFAVSRIAARIVLGKDWVLSTNKDDFVEYQDELADAIYERCAELMQSASEQALSVEDLEFNRELASVVVTSGRDSKREKRNRTGDSAGSIQPKNTGRKRRTASQTTDNPGSVVDPAGVKSRRSGFTIETYEANSSKLGYYDPDGNRVRLNISNSWLAAKHRERCQDALIPVVYGILAEFATNKNANKHPLFKSEIDGDFCDIWGQTVESAAEREVVV